MSQVELPLLREHLAAVARRSGLGKRLGGIAVEADRDNEGSDFLRVTVEFASIDDVDDEALEGFVNTIEEAVAELDERFPSVRFLAEA